MKKFVALLMLALIALVTVPIAGASETTTSYDVCVVKPPGITEDLIGIIAVDSQNCTPICLPDDSRAWFCTHDIAATASRAQGDLITNRVDMDAPKVRKWPQLSYWTFNLTCENICSVQLPGIYAIWYASNDY